MKLTEKLILENHRDEFSATSGKPSISPSPLRLTSMHFSDVFPASEKKSNPTRQCSRDCAPVIEIPEISQHVLLAKDLVTWQAIVGRHIIEDIVGRVAQYVDEHYLVDKWHLGDLIAWVAQSALKYRPCTYLRAVKVP
ncbi:hypothetical protein TNCV_649591 [Trichonephila clavipes]|nr:hypothetical protein TNCV_649591 [Trichonephila clavipes]